MAFVGGVGAVKNGAAGALSSKCGVAGHARAVAGVPRVRSVRVAARGSDGVVAMAVQAPELEEKARAELKALYEKTPCMPIMVRLAWHDAGTYRAATNTGGANASIRYGPEIAHGANAGLKIAIDLLEPIKAKVPEMSYADLFQLASVVGIEFGGGPKIPFKMGRKDATEEECTEDGRLPDATQGMKHLREVFYGMGLDDKEILLLSGAHTFGRAHSDRSGFEDKPWTKKPLDFDNTYFVELLANNDPSLLRLVSDEALMSEEELLGLVKLYAEDKEAFFKDYSAAHVKLSELGCSL
ncbi:L-ascorbate peroxidase 3, peroxisomal [Porphyridium purpureum]|uniref:L-ascorbate peroxidase 3, peroxisomal n=1 Tax=Porphyridium purpureum TaxID=35688 RepID=A0A5J4YZ49_PORPP|nr:L-ascorbate peroxidase 3, peroxisomal [Porphyridium purpureum]|eukprot:POR7659..scf208_2